MLILLTFSTWTVKSHLIVLDQCNQVSKFTSLFLGVRSLVLGNSLAGCREGLFLQLLLIFQNLKMGKQAKKLFKCIYSLIPASMSPRQLWKCGLKKPHTDKSNCGIWEFFSLYGQIPLTFIKYLNLSAPQPACQ